MFRCTSSTMSIKRFTKLFVAAMVVVGMVGCGDDDDDFTGGSKTDPALNGTWVDDGFSGGVWTLKFNNGNFENLPYGDAISERGTYTTDHGIISFRITHINLEGSEGAKWYTRAEYLAEWEMTLEEYHAMGARLDWAQSYSVSDNTLNIVGEGGENYWFPIVAGRFIRQGSGGNGGNGGGGSGDISATFTMNGAWWEAPFNYYGFHFLNYSDFDVIVTIDGVTKTFPKFNTQWQDMNSSTGPTKIVTYSPSDKVRFEKEEDHPIYGDVITFFNK